MASGGTRGDISPAVAAAFDEMRGTIEKPRRIALLGSAPSSIKLAPFGDSNWELWGCSPGCAQHLKPEQVHSWFEIHAWDVSRADIDADYIAFMRAIKGPVYAIAPVAELPNSVAFPLDAMLKRFGNRFFTSTVSYMLALAIAQDNPPSEIGLWGIDMAANSEYFTQKPACHYFFGLAEQAGIKITVPPQSDLLQPLPLYSNNDVVESNGQSGWIRYSPVESWHAYLEDENKLAFYTGTAWQGLPNTDSPASSTLGYAVFEDQRTNDAVGGTATINAWTARTLQTSVVNTITSASLAANAVTLPAGKYLIIANASFWKTGWTQLRFKSTTTATALTGPNINMQAATQGGAASVTGILNLPATEAFKLEYFVEATVGASDLGAVLGTQSQTEVYAQVQIIDLASLQGGIGNTGAQGPQGFAGFKYTFSTTTAMADPGSGVVRLNNATLSSVTAAAVDILTAETGAPDISAEIALWTSPGGILRIAKVGAEQNFITYTVSASTNQTGWYQLTLVYRASAGAIANSDSVSLQFIPKGEVGATGPSIPVYDYDFNTATAGDPGSGKLLFNNATLSSATTISISDNDKIVVDRSADIATWDDDGATANRGYIYGINASTGARVFKFKATGSITDNATYQTMSVTHVSGSAPANNTRIAVFFVPAGASGAIGGSTGVTDNRLLRADGVGGATLQNTGITVDDSDNATGIAALGATTIELGHASDTTLARVSAGVAAIEGVNILTTGTDAGRARKQYLSPQLQ